MTVVPCVRGAYKGQRDLCEWGNGSLDRNNDEMVKHLDRRHVCTSLPMYDLYRGREWLKGEDVMRLVVV